MMNPLLHHGMVFCGLPYTLPELNNTTTGGTPYGPSHYAGPNSDMQVSDAENRLCLAMGKRIAELALKLGN